MALAGWNCTASALVERLVRLFKKSRDNWKAKALERQRRIRALEVTVRDLKQSRDAWRARALSQRDNAADHPPAEASEPEEHKPPVERQEAAAQHQYPVPTIQLSLRLVVEAYTSLRGTCKVLELLAVAGTRTAIDVTVEAMQTYVISLKSRHKCKQTPQDLISAIRKLPNAKIVEGEGLRSVTVEMPEHAVRVAEQEITFATIEEYGELKLL